MVEEDPLRLVHDVAARNRAQLVLADGHIEHHSSYAHDDHEHAADAAVLGVHEVVLVLAVVGQLLVRQVLHPLSHPRTQVPLVQLLNTVQLPLLLREGGWHYFVLACCIGPEGGHDQDPGLIGQVHC